MIHPNSLDTICAALCSAMGIDAPKQAAAADPSLCTYAMEALEGRRADRIFMYNPDAIARWIWDKYPWFVRETAKRTTLAVPLCSAMPSVTPVNFGTMYTGAQPEVHGIRAYVKPVITIDTIFDALIRSGKKPAIVSTANDSMSMIFLNRPMDYFIYPTVEEVNAKAAELILADEPTGNLDVETGHNIVKLLREICAQGSAILMITHNLNMLKDYPGKVFKFENHHIEEMKQ